MPIGFKVFVDIEVHTENGSGEDYTADIDGRPRELAYFDTREEADDYKKRLLWMAQAGFGKTGLEELIRASEAVKIYLDALRAEWDESLDAWGKKGQPGYKLHGERLDELCEKAFELTLRALAKAKGEPLHPSLTDEDSPDPAKEDDAPRRIPPK